MDMKTLSLILAPVLITAAQIWAPASETPEWFLSSLTPNMESIQRERGHPLDYEHKGSLSLEECSMLSCPAWRREVKIGSALWSTAR